MAASCVSRPSTCDSTSGEVTDPEVGDHTTLAVFPLAACGLTSSRNSWANADCVFGREKESLNSPLKVVARTATPAVASTQISRAASGLRMAQVDSDPTVLPLGASPQGFPQGFLTERPLAVRSRP